MTDKLREMAAWLKDENAPEPSADGIGVPAMLIKAADDIDRLTTEVSQLKESNQEFQMTLQWKLQVQKDAEKLVGQLTAEGSALRAALSNLVYVKDWKDKNGKDETYRALQPASWEAARKALQKTTPSGSQASIWKSEPPTEPRWYWWRQGDRIEPARVIQMRGFLAAVFIGEDAPIHADAWQPDWLWAEIAFPEIEFPLTPADSNPNTTQDTQT